MLIFGSLAFATAMTPTWALGFSLNEAIQDSSQLAFTCLRQANQHPDEDTSIDREGCFAVGQLIALLSSSTRGDGPGGVEKLTKAHLYCLPSRGGHSSRAAALEELALFVESNR